MITINCTGKLRKEIDFVIEEISENEVDDFYNWHAHLVNIKRRKTLILMNVETRYSICLYGLKKDDFKNLNNIIVTAIEDNLKFENIKDDYIEDYMSQAAKIRYSKTYSRSIISSLNYIKRMIESRIEDYLPAVDKNLLELNQANNRIPILTMEPAYSIDSLRQVFKKRLGRTYEQIYKFKISLKDIEPLIWRKIEVPADYTFWDLHVAIQDAMGWADYHLHEFRINRSEIGIPDESFNNQVLASWKEKIADYFTLESKIAEYIYDFGDYWQHIVELEEIKPAEKDRGYPICLDGARACPPEDCGGLPGYYNLLEILNDPDHEEYDFILEWLDGEYEPDYFASSEVEFDNPRKRLTNLK